MALPPPKLYDLQSFIQITDSQSSESLELWEIGVPATHGLYWSVVLSYLLSSEESEFSGFFNKLTSIKDDTNTTRNIDFRTVKNRIKNFNPFKNRYVFFFDEIMIEVFRKFKKKLNSYAYNLKSDNQEWSDEVKLEAVSSLLNCQIDVYFPEESGKCFMSFPTRKKGNLPSKIVLFQYKNQKYKSRKTALNIFRFAMSVNHAHSLQISALSFILKKAKFSSSDISFLKQLMYEPKAHGKYFLPTILISPHFRLIPGMYKSPYIALKLSEAGFETNPLITDPEKPSALLLSMTKPNTKYVRILYDYAINCRYLFDRSVRNADETVLVSLEMVQNILSKDGTHLHYLNIDSKTKERTLRVQSEFLQFNKYQQNIAMALRDLRLKLGNEPSKAEVFNVRKEVIKRILELYRDFFSYNSPDSSNTCDAFYNYLSCDEYYENIDSFSCLSFFDNIHMLKKIFQLKDDDIYANIESRFFLLIISNRYFLKFKHAVRCNTVHDEIQCERNRNVLRFIPFLHREELKLLMGNFLEELKRHKESPVPEDRIKDESLRSSLCSQPEIRDELLISRIKKYLNAALDVSFEENRVKGIFVIERVLQVLGESIKPQSTEGCVVSCMIGSRLPAKLKQNIINIRNDLSHYRDSLVPGRMISESDEELFDGLKGELKTILESFEIVAFTQYLRLEESLMDKGLQELEKYELDKSVIGRFLEEYETRLQTRKKGYEKYHEKCIKLSLEIINDLKDYLEENFKKKRECKNIKWLESNVIGKLRTTEYIFLVMSKLIKVDPFQSCLSDIKDFRENFERQRKTDSLRYDIECFLIKYIETIKRDFRKDFFSNPVSENIDAKYPKLENFLNNLKKKVIYKSDLKTIVEVVKISYDEAVVAKENLKMYIDLESFCLSEKEELLLRKLLISRESLVKLRKCFKETNKDLALKELSKKWITKDDMVENVCKLFRETCLEDINCKTLLIKLAYQKHLPTSIYSVAKFNDQICVEIDAILMKKVDFLLSRIKDIKAILIDDDEEIKEAWKWGRSKGIKYHMRFLMRQRFLKEMTFRASLEMAFFDCLNILMRKEFKEMFEKLDNLFSGINLRDVMSHGHSILETVGGLLDEDDLPSELINKMLDLIEDADAIESMKELLPCSGTLEKESFEMWISNYEGDDERLSGIIKIIKKCPRWTTYVCLLPLI